MDKLHTSLMVNKIRAFADAPDHHALRPHQEEMLHAVATHLENGETNGTIKAATGTGKTYALGAMAVASDEPTVIITPRNLIGDQTIKTFFDPEKFQLNVREKVGLYDSQQTDAERETSLGKKILITTYPSFLRLVEEGKISADPNNKNFRSNIILDEAHRATGERFSQTLKPFLNHSIVTAWTATDQFIDSTRVDDRLFGKPNRIYTLELEEAVRRGLLADAVHAIGVEVGVHAEDIEALKRRNKDYPEAAVKKFAQMDAVQEQAVEMYMNYEHPETHIRFRGLPCVLTTVGVRAAEQTAVRFNKAMGRDTAVVVSGDTPKKQLRNNAHTGILDRFDRGEIKVLCAADLLIEGFDSKDASLVFSLRPSKSPWLVEQILGRGARKQSDEYFDKYNHDKQLFAVNFFGQGMQPLLFSDVMQNVSLSSQVREPRGPRENRESPVRYEPIQIDTPPRIFHTTTEMASLKKDWEVTKTPSSPRKATKTPSSPEGWYSNKKMSELYVGHDSVHKKLIENLYAEKKASGMPKKEVNKNWAGWFAPKTGNHAWYISPLGLEELEKTGKIKNKIHKAPQVPEGWMSGSSLMLSKKYIGQTTTLSKAIQDYATTKEGEGLTKDEVHKSYAGVYTNSGRETWFISPTGLEELYASGKIRLKTDRAPIAPKGWISKAQMYKLYSCEESKNQIECFVSEKEAEGLSEDDIRTKYVSYYTNLNQEALHISPAAIKELEESGRIKLKRKSIKPDADHIKQRGGRELQ